MYRVNLNKVTKGKLYAADMMKALKKIKETVEGEVLLLERASDTEFRYAVEKRATKQITDFNVLNEFKKDGWTVLSMEKFDSKKHTLEKLEELTQPIEDQEIDSSWVSGINYNFEERILTVNTQSGNEYMYEDVPYNIYQDFLAADSAGRYFNRVIKGKFERRGE